MTASVPVRACGFREWGRFGDLPQALLRLDGFFEALAILTLAFVLAFFAEIRFFNSGQYSLPAM